MHAKWLTLAAAFLMSAACGAGTADVDSAASTSASHSPSTARSPAASSSTTESPVASTARPGGWHDVNSPLSPRANALGVWTGAEVLIVGGDPEAWCAPGADCIPPGFESLADGALYDPANDQWRPISDAPTSITRFSSVVIVDDTVFVLTHPLFTADGRSDGRFLRFEIAEDRWSVLPTPAGSDHQWYRLIVSNGNVIAYSTSDEQGEQPDRFFDESTDTWVELPPDPLSPSFDRFLVPLDDRLLLFAKDLVGNPGSAEPSLAGIAELDRESGRWDELGTSEILGTEDGFAVGRSVVFPWTGEADGGQVNNWGRSYPYGGIYDTAAGTWTPLPDPSRSDSFEIAGVVDDQQAAFHRSTGAVLDLEDQRWLDLPALPDLDAEVTVINRTIVGTGPNLFVFGGESWAKGSGEVTAAAYIIDPSASP